LTSCPCSGGLVTAAVVMRASGCRHIGPTPLRTNGTARGRDRRLVVDLELQPSYAEGKWHATLVAAMTFGERVRELREVKTLALRAPAGKVGVGFSGWRTRTALCTSPRPCRPR